MERKTKNRILGFIVIVALGVILIPFFEGGTGPLADATIVKAPPFPNQSAQTSTTQTALNPPLTLAQNNSGAFNQQPDDTISSNSPMSLQPIIKPVSNTEAITPDKTNVPANETKSVITEIKPDPKKNISDDKLTPEKQQADVAPSKAVELKQDSQNDDLPTSNATDDEDDETSAPSSKETKLVDKTPINKAPETIKPVVKAVLQESKKINDNTKHVFVPEIKPFIPEERSTLAMHAPLDANGLAKLKNAAWVIQLGSFKNKSNAIHLANQLRAKGYRAFIQQVSTSFGDGTRVFVGPEPKQASARLLATQLESNMHLRGIVISYKPLAL